MTGGPKVQIAGFCFPEIQFVQIAIRKDYITDERKKGAARPVQALCGTFTPTANLSSEAVLRRILFYVTVVGKIADGLCDSLCWREYDGQLNSYFVSGSGSWDCPYKASIVSIDPTTAAMTTIFQTSYHTIMGLAKKPGKNAYFSWINWTTHFYGEVDLNTRNITACANSDAVGVTSGAMIYRDFYVTPAPNLPPCSFTDEDCLGL